VRLGGAAAAVAVSATAFTVWSQSNVNEKVYTVSLATIALLPAAVARLPLAFIQRGGSFEVFAVVDIPLLVCVAYDLITRRRVHPALLAGGAFLVASQPLRIALGGTELWLSFARWLVG